MTPATEIIPKGYKQSEIGMIPEDWEINPLSAIVEKYIDYRGRTPKKLGLNWGGGDILALSANNVQMGKIDTEKESYFGSPELYRKWMVQGECERGDVLLTMEAPLGNVAQIPDNKKYILSQRVILVKPKHFISKDYLSKLFTGTYFQTELLKNASGTTAQGIQRQKLNKIEVYYPKSKEEQSAIAEAISDANSLITKLAKLIKKRKNIKQGAMQELLTGKKRLPGFSGKWVRKKLGEIGEFTGSGVDKKIRKEEISVRLLNFLDVFNRTYLYSQELNHQVTARPEQLQKCSIRKGDIFFTPSSEMPFDIGIAAVAMEDMPGVVYSYHVDRFRLSENWDLLFRAYIFQTKDFSDQTASQCEGSGKRYVLNLTTFRERLSVYYPTDKGEQEAISKILFDTDSEIEKLEEQLEKYRNIKQGMMQMLLTGKIRLV